MTTTKREPVVIEITDEAYKQNSVYRPWNETSVSTAPARLAVSFTTQQALKMLAAFHREQATPVIPV